MRPNLFTLLYMITVAFGGLICAIGGIRRFGPMGGIVGAILGVLLGHLMGQLGSSTMNRLTERSYRRMSTDSLRAELEQGYTAETYISCLIISILLERGEPVASLREFVFRQLNFPNVCHRRAGLVNLKLCYPKLADQLEGFNTWNPTDEDLRRLKSLEAQTAL